MGMLCRNGCGATITFDPEVKSSSGKVIPVDSITHQPHQCPNSDYSLKHKNNQLGKSAIEVVVEMQSELREFKDRMERMEKRLSEVELLRWKQFDAKD